eukprot:862361-Pleurochrysis_carterae.AAC.3
MSVFNAVQINADTVSEVARCLEASLGTEARTFSLLPHSSHLRSIGRYNLKSPAQSLTARDDRCLATGKSAPFATKRRCQGTSKMTSFTKVATFHHTV